MAEDQRQGLDLTVLEGAPGDGADVLFQLEPPVHGGCDWPAGGCRKTAGTARRNGDTVG